MKVIVLLVGIIVLSVVGFFALQTKNVNLSVPLKTNPNTPQNTDTKDLPATQIVAEGLDTPWGIAFLPDNSILITERSGVVRRVTSEGKLETDPIAIISDATEIGEGGLLGIEIDPNFSNNKYVYLYYTYDSSGNNTRNRVVRTKYTDGTLKDEEIIVDNIPGASNHNGGRIKFGPDGLLYITTGDAQEPSLAQSTTTLAGKILRVTPEGEPAPNNPFNNSVYSYGHRNSQGIAWDSKNNLWETEHGRSGIQSGLDEVNNIESGKNYGWPEIEGNETRSGMVTPRLNSTASVTWAPGGSAIQNDILYFTGLRGQGLYSVDLNTSTLTATEHFKSKFGRIREVIVGPDGLLYITTSNKDGRGTPLPGDDKVIRINPSKL